MSAGHTEFSGGRNDAAKILGALGFEVAYTGDAESASADGRGRTATEMGQETVREEWARAAREVLLDAARHYRSVVTYGGLAAEVQRRTGITTRQLMQHWIGDVLGRVSAECARRGEPLLSSLCVTAEGSVGPGYVKAVRDAYGEEPEDLDDHAAHERLACHRHFEAPDLPPDGGGPALTRKLAASRERAARQSTPTPRTTATCPTCHLQLPATGVCDDCG